MVTGTVHAGRATVDDELFVFPLGLRGRVRDLRVQDHPAVSATTGDRAAVNLAGLPGQALCRGHWLCGHAESGHQTLVLDFRVLDDFPRHVRHWTPVHVYHATSHVTGRLALLEGSRLEPGARSWVELILDGPLPAKRGDRLVIRDQALERTLGGGSVIDNRPNAGRRRAPARLAGIRASAAPSAEAALAALLDQGPVDVPEFNGLWDLPNDQIDALERRLAAIRHDRWLIDEDQWLRWREALLAECRRRHAADPSLPGLRENDFQSPVPPEFRSRLLAELAAGSELTQQSGRFRPRQHTAELTAEEQRLLERLDPLIDQTQPPSLGDLARTLRIPLDRLKAGVKALAGKGRLIQVNDKRVYAPRHLTALIETAEALSRRGPFSARDYRDAAGIGRNVAIEVLEYLDSRGFTRRQGDARTVVGDRSKLPTGLR